MQNANTSAFLGSEIAKLYDRLKETNSRYAAGAEDHGRSPVRDQLNSVIQFVSEIFPDGAELTLPLNQLLYALKDLDSGQAVPLLEAAKVNNRPPEPLGTRLFECMAAALMELYVRARLPRKKAAWSAARDLSRCGYRDRKRQAITATQVENWRDKMRTAERTTDLAAQRYVTCLKELSSLFPEKPGEAAKFLLDVLPGLVAPAIPRMPAS